MTHRMTFQFLPCQTCSAKIHCEQCGEDVVAKLRQHGIAGSIDMNMNAKSIAVDTDMDIDDLEILLEDLGLLVD